MKKVIWPITIIISLTFSTLAFVLGSRIMAKTQIPPPISITYPAGYLDLPEVAKSVVKTAKIKAKKPVKIK